MRALLLVTLALVLSPAAALAQSSLNAYGQDYPLAKPNCSKAPIFAQDWDAIAANAFVAAAPEGQRTFCAFIGQAQDGPWRRYAVVEFRGDHWCDTTGCAVVLFIEDRKGRWRAAMSAAEAPRGPAVGEGAAIDFSTAVDGLPGIALPGAVAGGTEYRSWVFDPSRKAYRRAPLI